MSKNADFAKQVQDLLTEGKITTEEAKELLSINDDFPSSTDKFVAENKGNPPQRLLLQLTAGDVKVRGNPEITVPRFSGNAFPKVQLSVQGDAWVLQNEHTENILAKLSSLFNIRAGDFYIEVPTHMPYIEVQLLAGEIDVKNVLSFVTVHSQAGEINVQGAKGFDIHSKAGNVTIETTLINEKSRIEMLAGNVGVRLLNSDCQIHLRLGVGDVSHSGLEPLGEHNYVVGKGNAELLIKVKAGNVDVHALGV